MSPSSHQHRSLIPDAGWLFVFAGLGIIASAVLIPASEALQEARFQRDRALVSEQLRLDRLDRYRAYLLALDERQPALLAQLRAIQLNQYPEGMRPLGEPAGDPALASASVFEMLEPPVPAEPEPPAFFRGRSRLAELAHGERSHLWLIAGGAVCLLIGVLPPARVKPRRRERTSDAAATVSA
ncbi:MAG TPA: hypothetical protein ENJ00_01675 [Phycisphaerales bacterium]|nr:hypothetical protein [Phycisphaerales bacterium]